MSSRSRELGLFVLTLALLLSYCFQGSLIGGKILSPADNLFVTPSFRSLHRGDYEPINRLLMDPVLQFQPWLAFTREKVRSGRFPLWNSSSGCGSPLLANGQSAVFDPFQSIAYLSPSLAPAYAWMAVFRLMFAGIGAFLLARRWGYLWPGRWFAGLVFPFSGFLIGWLLYPVTNVAIWLPWLLLVTDRLAEGPTYRRAAWLATCCGGAIFGGHIQTTAHVLLAMGVYAAWLAKSCSDRRRFVARWTFGVTMGFALGAIQILPLAGYLGRSPVWQDRDRDRLPAWSIAKPRLLEIACTGLPSIYGSQRRGEPNLAKGLGVDNQNESAGGFAGLITLAWLLPVAVVSARRSSRTTFLIFLFIVGFFAAFRLPPIDNLLRLVPVLKVTDNRRLTLWVAFSSSMLGGVGIDQLARCRAGRGWRWLGLGWLVVSTVCLAVAVAVVPMLRPKLERIAADHYREMASRTPGASAADFQERANRQVDSTLTFLPRVLIWSGAQGLASAAILWGLRRRRLPIAIAQVGILVIVMADLIGYSKDLNPSIGAEVDRMSNPVIEALLRRLGHGARVVGVGAELPPNVAMRYGLSDVRNYDSVELTRSLDWFEPIYDPDPRGRTSRRDVTWSNLARSIDRLREAGVQAAVGPTPPPDGLGEVQEVDGSWIVWIEARPVVEWAGPGELSWESAGDGSFVASRSNSGPGDLIIRETFDRAWRAEADGADCPIRPHRDAFLAVRVPPGTRRIALTYDPIEFRMGLYLTLFAASILVFALTGSGSIRSTRTV